jgi:hypothetical protein
MGERMHVFQMLASLATNSNPNPGTARTLTSQKSEDSIALCADRGANQAMGM